MFDIMSKLGEVKQKMDEIKSRLNDISVVGTSNNDKVKVVVNGNRIVKSIAIDDELFSLSNKEELIDHLEIALNKALEQAEQVSEAEMKAVGKSFLPGF